MKFELSDLSYERSALEPHISENRLNCHYGKHHAGYVKQSNDAIRFLGEQMNNAPE